MTLNLELALTLVLIAFYIVFLKLINTQFCYFILILIEDLRYS